jgi:hypothetical protein
MPLVSGRSAVEAWLTEAIGNERMHVAGDDSSKITIERNEAYVTGSFSTNRTSGSRTETRRGKYVELWRFTGGQWMVAYQVFGSESSRGKTPIHHAEDK